LGVSVLLGKSDGSFRAAQSYAVGIVPVSVAAGDFNGDGIPDLAVANLGSRPGTVSVLLAKGDGTFQAAYSYAASYGPRSVAVADFNGDGHLDLAVANQGGYPLPDGSVSILLGNADGTFQVAHNYAVSHPSSVAVGDLDHDGHVDLVITNVNSNTVSVLLGN